jgi:ABC-2 type transport system ATP-binding protein
MQRRIGIAQALINDPELLILDEPTTGLDPIGTRQIKDLILTLGRRGKSILLSSHLLADVEDCVDRMVILYGGKIREEGTCDDLLTSAEKAVIETDALDDATIAEIDQVIRRRSGGQKGINRVSKPRQKLEDKFIDIVDRAIAERVETSGARHGGATASFLQAGVQEGDALIDSLVKASDEPPAAPPAPVVSSAEQPDPTKPDAGLISSLTGDAPAETPAGRPTAGPAARPAAPGPGAQAQPSPQGEVDDAVIRSLLGGDSSDPGKGGPTGGRG